MSNADDFIYCTQIFDVSAYKNVLDVVVVVVSEDTKSKANASEFWGNKYQLNTEIEQKKKVCVTNYVSIVIIQLAVPHRICV